MPYLDPEQQRKANRESKKRSRARKAGLPEPAPAARAMAGTLPALVSVRDLDLSALAETIKAETDNLSLDGWLNLQGALGLELLALVRESLKSTLLIRSVKDVAHLLKLAQSLIDPVIASKGNLGGDDPLPCDMQDLHAQMLADPAGLEMAQSQMQLLSQLILARQPKN